MMKPLSDRFLDHIDAQWLLATGFHEQETHYVRMSADQITAARWTLMAVVPSLTAALCQTRQECQTLLSQVLHITNYHGYQNGGQGILPLPPLAH